MVPTSETAAGDAFDSDFIADLEGLVVESGAVVSSAAAPSHAEGRSAQALTRLLAGEDGRLLDEAGFLALPTPMLADRCNRLLEWCRDARGHAGAVGVESFVVFFQTLVPTLADEAAREVRATFFRLAPTLVHLASEEAVEESESAAALRLLETILLEVSSVRLTPAEDALLFKSLDQLAALIAAGEYALARDVVAAPLLAILRKNRVSRSLFRLMEVEVAIQVYLKERLGYFTPQVRLPDDLAALSEFGPVRTFEETDLDGKKARYLQVQLPDIPILSDIVLHLVGQDGSARDVRLDGLGTGLLDLPDGLYSLGLVYEPEESRRGS